MVSGNGGLPPLAGVTLIAPSPNVTLHGGPITHTPGTCQDPFVGKVSCQRGAMQVPQDLGDQDSKKPQNV